MPYLSTTAGLVFLDERGQGRPVVMLHANLHDHHDYDTVAASLARDYRTLAMDWPGHGASGTADGSPGAASLARALNDLVHRLDLPPALVIGNSVGGYAALRLAIDAPRRVAGLVLVNPGGLTAPSPASRLACRLLGSPAVARRVLPRLVPRYMRPTSESDRRIVSEVCARARSPRGAATAAAIWRSFGDPAFDVRAAARAITAPALVVWGLRDPIFPRSAPRAATAAVPGSRLCAFDTGHVVFSSDPEGFLAVVRPFAASVFSDSVFSDSVFSDSVFAR